MRENVLVLNANYEPINICNMRRAVGLMIKQKATLVENGRGMIRSASNEFPKPSIIRLNYMIHRPRAHVKLTRKEVFRRDDFTCQYCGKKTGVLTIDHVLPRHLGGRKIWTNIVTACSACNHRKGGRTLEESKMRLLKTPVEPSSSATYLYGHYLHDCAEWEPYLTGW